MDMLRPLVPWDSDVAHALIVWRTKLDDRYLVEVQRDPTDGYKAQLVIFDHERNDEEIMCWDVGLSYGALFGPDVDDVSIWQDKVIDFVDTVYGKGSA